MARGDPCRKISEERRDLGRDLRPCVDVLDPPRSSSRACCTTESGLQMRIEPLDRGRHDVGHDARALAAAEHQEAQRPRLRRGVGRRRRRHHRRPHRVAGARRLAASAGLAQHAGKAGGDGGHARPAAYWPAHHRVLFVDQRRDLAQRRRQHRRHGRVAPETHHRGRADSPDHLPPARSSPSSVAVRANDNGSRPRTVALATR